MSAATLASSLRADSFLALCQNAGFAGHWSVASAAYCTWNSCLPQAKQGPFHLENRMYPTTSPVSSTWGFRSLILAAGLFCPYLPSLQLFSCSLLGINWELLIIQARQYIEPSFRFLGCRELRVPSLSRLLWPFSKPSCPTVLSLTLLARSWVIKTVFIPQACRNLQGSSRLCATL